MIIVVDLSLHSLSKIEWDITRERLRKRENVLKSKNVKVNFRIADATYLSMSLYHHVLSYACNKVRVF